LFEKHRKVLPVLCKEYLLSSFSQPQFMKGEEGFNLYFAGCQPGLSQNIGGI